MADRSRLLRIFRGAMWQLEIVRRETQKVDGGSRAGTLNAMRIIFSTLLLRRGANTDGRRAQVLIAALGIIPGFLFLPELFERFFAVAPLVAPDRLFLECLVAFCLGISLFLVLSRAKAAAPIAAAYFGLLCLFALELTARLVINAGFPEVKHAAAAKALFAYPELTVYRAHPFLQFTGNPRAEVVQDKVFANLGSFNNFGFFGPNFHYAKDPGVVR